MGPLYDKQGLEKMCEANHEKFVRVPDPRDNIRSVAGTTKLILE